MLQRTNKKGVSEIVSYVLLIIIAVSIAALVFGFLKLYIPKFQTPECPTDISIVVGGAICNAEENLQVTLQNKGFFTIDTVYVRLKEEGRSVKVNFSDTYDFPVIKNGKTGLPPGENHPILFNFGQDDSVGAGSYTLEVEPAVKNDKGELALCESAIISQKVVCSS